MGRQRPALSLYVGLKAYEALPPLYKEAIAVGVPATPTLRFGRQVRRAEPKALRELVAGGTKFLPFPQSVMEASFNAANETLCRDVAKNPKFKKVYDSWKPFRNEEVLWFRVVENTFDNFMARQSAADKL